MLPTSIISLPTGSTGRWYSWSFPALRHRHQHSAGLLCRHRSGLTSGRTFQGGYCLDALRRTGTLVFDKTGTLTEGRFSISHAVCGPAVKDEAELLYYLSAVERGSTHPLALAIVKKAEQLGVKGDGGTAHP